MVLVATITIPYVSLMSVVEACLDPHSSDWYQEEQTSLTTDDGTYADDPKMRHY